MQENNLNESNVPFALYAQKAKLTMIGSGELLSAGMAGVVQVRLSFSEDWQGLEKTAVFTNGTRTVRVAEEHWDEGLCTVPAEVLQTPGKTVMAGVYGANGLHLVLPTVWCVLGRVEPAADLSGEPVDPVALRDLGRRLDALEAAAVTEQTVSDWGFTKHALTEHQSLSGLVPRAAQAARTADMTQAVGVDADGALWTVPGGAVHTLAATQNGDTFTYYDADFLFASLDEVITRARTGEQFRLAVLPSMDVYALTHMLGVQATARLYFTGLRWGTGMEKPVAEVFEVDDHLGIRRLSSVDFSAIAQLSDLPAYTSQLTNDSGFLAETDEAAIITAVRSGGILRTDRGFAEIYEKISGVKPVYLVDVTDLPEMNVYTMERADINNHVLEVSCTVNGLQYRALLLDAQDGRSMSGALVTAQLAEAFPIHLQTEGAVVSADRTPSEIYAAVCAEKTVQVFLDGCYCGWLGYADASTAALYVLEAHDSPPQLVLYLVSANGVTRSGRVLQSVAEVVPVSGAAPVIDAADNKIYQCGELTSLTIRSFPIYGEFTLRFVSGAAAAALNVPSNLKLPDGFTVAANTRYELRVTSGYAVEHHWTVQP